MNKYVKISTVFILFLLLIGVRFFEDVFNDPLQNYFEQDYLTEPLPELNYRSLVLLTLLRYLINSILSIGIIYFLFPQMKVLDFTVKFYTFIMIFLIIAFIYLLNQGVAGGYMPLFYVRRLLINPIFILVLIPAFYYQKIHK